MKALSDDLMEFGDLQQAMRYLMQRGMDTENGDNMRGLRELLQQLKDERRQRLERIDIGSTMEDIRRQLNEILDMEKKTINDWIDEQSPDMRKSLSRAWRRLTKIVFLERQAQSQRRIVILINYLAASAKKIMNSSKIYLMTVQHDQCVAGL